MAEDNIVSIGKKPSMNYVLAVVTQFNNNAKTVTVRARGRSISKAVDVAEIVRNRFMPELRVKDIRIGTDQIKTEEGPTINVSSIEVDLAKGGK